MKAIICGGRDFRDWTRLSATLDALHAELHFDRVANGAAPGADTLAGSWARSRGIRTEAYPALWRTHGAAAGPIRNRKMLDVEKPDIVIAFPGGKGTANMVKLAKEAGVEVHIIQ
jgi:hypothetical protein